MKQELRNKDTGTPIVRYRKSFFHAIDGIVYAMKYEHNMIIIFLATLVTISLGLLLKISVTEWLFCVLVIGLVAGAEMINTAIEAVVDLETLKTHPLAKIAKDCGSSATLIFSLTALAGGLMIYIPKIMEYLK